MATTFRCSSLPLLMSCPMSAHVREDDGLTDAKPEVQTGRRVHELLARMVNGEEVPLDGEPDEVRRLYFAGREFWREYGATFGPVDCLQVEQRLEREGTHWTLTGHPDLWAFDGETNTLRVLDWKSGYKSATDYRWQLVGYAVLAGALARAERIEMVVVYLSDRTTQAFAMTGEELREAWVTVRRRLDAIALGLPEADDYSTGAHCTEHHCRPNRCPMHAKGFEMLLKDPAPVLEGMTGEQVGELWGKLAAYDKIADALKDAVRARLRASGPIALGDGRELALSAQKGRGKLDTDKAVGVLAAEGWTADDLMSCAELHWPTIKDVAGSKAPRGAKSGAILALEERMIAAGALTVGQTEVVRVRKTTDKKEIES